MAAFRALLFSLFDRLSRSQKRVLLLAIDVICAPLALLLAVSVVYSAVPTVPFVERMALQFAVVTLLATVTSLALGLHRVQLKAYESRAILNTAFASVLLTLGFGLSLAQFGPFFPGTGVVLFGLMAFLLSVTTRVLLLHLLQWVLRLGQPRKRVLIYGAGNTGVQLAAALRAHQSIMPVAFVDDNAALHGMSVAGLRVHGSDRITQIARRFDVDRVILAMPSVPAPRLAQVARRMGEIGLQVMSVPSFAQLIGEEALVDSLTPVVPGRFLNRRQIDGVLAPAAGAYAGRVVLVSGAGGSVGSELCRQLLALRPRRLVLFDVSEIALYSIDRELRELNEGLDIEIVPVLGSATDARMARMVMRDNAVEVVVHAAAYKHVPLVEANPIAGLANNVLGTRTMGDAANEAGVKRFVLVSTDKAVRPTNIMGASKRLAELVIQDLAKRSSGCVFSIVRFGNVLGSSGSVVPLFKEQIARGGPVTLTHDDVTRYFMTIAEAVKLILLAGSFADPAEGSGGDVYVLDMGKPVRIRDLAVQMIEAAGCSVRDHANPNGDIEITVIGLRPGEKLHEELLIGEGLLTTPHPKILRAEERSLTELKMAAALRALRSAVAVGDADAARSVVSDYVEEYHGPTVPPQVAALP
ncbi:MAG: polysaccharide biosynthesis protein [Paracoccaceae bacterium]|nr:MAG: polysaccharide biosynthesis protein [Paracoccaceae bacterium]